MRIHLTSVLVDDQEKALRFYTEVLGFMKKAEVPLGAFKWLTVVSPEGPDGIELLLEPNENPAAKTFQKALYDSGIPLTSFATDDIQKEHERLKRLGVEFKQEPTTMGPVTVAGFDDTCGNWIQIMEKLDRSDRDEDEAESERQERIREATSKAVGAIDGNDPRRAEKARSELRSRLSLS